MSEAGIAAGWHPDPKGRFEQRYYDGVRWTEHVTTGGVPALDQYADRPPGFQRTATIPRTAEAFPPQYQPPKPKGNGGRVGCLLAVVAAIVVIGGLVAWGVSSIDVEDANLPGTTTPVETTAAPAVNEGNTERISLDEFNQLTEGMSYADAVMIIGGEGVVISEVNIADVRTVIYQWEGSNDSGFGANANATFQNDQLVSKAQLGLQ